MARRLALADWTEQSSRFLEHMEDRHLNSLVERLRNGQCILVLGPEIPADWSESGRGNDARTPATCADALKERLAEELMRADINPSMAGSLAAVAQLYEDREPQGFGPANLRSQAARFYASLRLKPSKDHEAIASLPSPLIVSTCHDQLLTDALTQAEKTPLVYRYHFRGTTEERREEKVPRPKPVCPGRVSPLRQVRRSPDPRAQRERPP